MAINKRKVLDSARKFAQKGAKQKALKEYEKLVKLDPRDAKLLLEIGDAYRRWGQAEEAIAQYNKVASQYKQDGFDARAVAVLKQILNLDPKSYTAYVTLADLYQRMSLNAEAVAALQTAADGYYRDGRRREALELLRKMAGLDPSNTTSRLKVADLLQQEDMREEAISEYEQVAEELNRQNASEQVTIVQQRILELQPDRVDVLTSLSATLVEMGRHERAEPFAVRALEAEPDPEKFEFLCTIYRNLKDDAKLADVTRGLVGYYRDRGDEDKAREITQRLPSEEMARESGVAQDQSEVEEEPVELELLEDDEFLVADDDLAPSDEPELELTNPALGADETTNEEPDGDPDQLLAEASVYLRYGKTEQAVVSLKAVLLQEPGHRAALEKLGEAHVEQSQTGPAIECWREAAERAREDGDASGYNVLLDRIRGLDPDACADMAEMDAGGSDDGAVAADPAEETDGDLELSLDYEDEDDDFSVDIEAEADEEVSGLDDDAPSLDASEVTTPIDSASEGVSATTTAKIDEDLEEAEFFLQQGLSDEAEDVYQRVLAAAPNHPTALLKLGELAAERGDDPNDASGGHLDLELELDDDDEETDLATHAGGEIDLDIDPEAHIDLVGEDATEVAVLPPDDDEEEEAEDGSFELDIDIDEEDDLASIMAAAEAAVEESDPVAAIDDDITGEDLLDDEEDESGESTTVPLDESADGSPEVTQRMGEGAEGEDFSEPLAADAADDGGSFDLSEALADVLDDGDEDPNETTAGGRPLSTVDDGFESLFSDFKKGVSATLEDGDFETRYDLGIAYREMGLFDDAISEFQVCLDSPSKRLESLYMMGLCAFEVGRLSDAVSHLEQALSTPDVPEERQVGIRFDLGRAYAAAGDPGRARSAFEALLAITDFPGAAEALADLGDAGSPTLADEEDGFESFDDLITEVEEGAEVVMEAETFENFDDVISEAESEMLDDEIVDAVPLSEEAEPSEAKLEKKKAKAGSAKPKKKAASKKKAARKKKISFT